MRTVFIFIFCYTHAFHTNMRISMNIHLTWRTYQPCKYRTVCLYLWPISWAMVNAVPSPVSSQIEQLLCRLHIPPIGANPNCQQTTTTWLITYRNFWCLRTQLKHHSSIVAGMCNKNKMQYNSVTPLLRDNLHWLRLRADHFQAVPSGLQGDEWTCTVIYKRTMCASQIVATRSALRSAARRDLLVPRTRRQLGNRAFSVAGPTAWNSLPLDIRTAPTPSTFKNLLPALQHF